MSAIYLYANSKSGDGPHEVQLDIEDGDLVISCTCPAGERDNLCRHLIGIILGDTSTLEERSPGQLDSLRTAQEWIGKSSCAKDVRKILALEQAVTELKMMKQKMTEGLRDGFPLS